jgi:protein Tex
MIKPGTGRQDGGPRRGNGQAEGQHEQGRPQEGRSQEGRSQGRGRDQNRSEGRQARPPRVPAAGAPANGGVAMPAAPRADRPQSRPQVGGGGRGGRGRPPQREQTPRVYVAKAEKVAKPLTKKMKEGKEPLRTFGDLKQFFTNRDEPPAAEPESNGEPTG